MAQRQVLRGARCLAFGLALILLAGGAVAFPSSPAVGSPDHQMEMNAREAFAAGRFDEALSLFAKLYAETLHPVYLRNIGRCHQKMRDPQNAIDSFRDYLAKAKKVSPDEKAEIEGYIREMEALQTEQARTATADKPIAAQAAASPVAQPAITPASALVPGPAPASPPPTISLASSAGAGSEQNGGDQRESPAPLYTRWWLWTGVGAVVIGGVVAALLLSSGTSRPPCPGVCM